MRCELGFQLLKGLDTRKPANHGIGFLIKDLKAQLRKAGFQVPGKDVLLFKDETYRNHEILPKGINNQTAFELIRSNDDEPQVTIEDVAGETISISSTWSAGVGQLETALHCATGTVITLQNKLSYDGKIMHTGSLSDNYDLDERNAILDFDGVFPKLLKICLKSRYNPEIVYLVELAADSYVWDLMCVWADKK